MNKNDMIVPYSKMGIKILRDRQLRNVFPAWEMLLGRIEKHRNGLKNFNRGLLKSDIQYNLMFDNVYSIMGKRGAGKTSVVFTVKELLKQQKYQYGDIVLPIIMPEMIPRDCSMIGWVLSLLETEVERIDDELKNLSRREQGYSERYDRCVTRNQNNLRTIYEDTKNLCYAQYYNVRHTDSFTDAVVNIDKMTQNSYDFSKKLIDFWDTLIANIKQTYSSLSGKKEEEIEPLIHIIFDDVDLVPEKAIDLFSTIIKYLSYPNIVVYVTADEELIFDVLENNMTRRLEKKDDLFMYNHVIGGIKREAGDEFFDGLKSFDDDVNKIRKKMLIKEKLIHETPKRYGEKVLPPSCRYYLETFEDINKKKDFIFDWYDDIHELKNSTNLKEVSIMEFVINEIDRYMEKVGIKDKGHNKNFLVHKTNNKEEFIAAYLLFWGSTSRQLTNEVFILNGFINRLIQVHDELKENTSKNKSYIHSRYCRRIYQIVRDFAYTTLIVAGSVDLPSDEIQNILDDVILYDENCGGIYIDYLNLREKAIQMYDDLRGRDLSDTQARRDMALKENIALFILAFFIEGILVLENETKEIEKSKERTKVHGMGLMVDVLDYYTEEGRFSLICKNLMKDVPSFLWYYGRILDQPHTLRNYNLFIPRTVRDYYSVLPSYSVDKEISVLNHMSPLWTLTIAQMLYFTNERIYNISQAELDVIRFNRNDIFNDLYYKESVQMIIEDLADLLSSLWDDTKFLEYSKGYKEIFVSELESDKLTKYHISYLQGEGIAHLQKRMINGTDPINFEKSCAKRVRADEVLKRNVFPDAYGTVSCSTALFQELQSIRVKILDLIKKFQWHRIYNFENIKESFYRNYILWEDTSIRLTDVEVAKDSNEHESGEVQENDKVTLIKSSELERLLTRISNAWRDNRSRYTQLYVKEESEYYNELYKLVTSNTALAIMDQDQLEDAKTIVMLFNYYSYTHRLYLLSFLKQTEETKYNYVDESIIPYKTFYNKSDGESSEIKKHIDEDDYLGRTIKAGIKGAVKDYIMYIVRGERDR